MLHIPMYSFGKDHDDQWIRPWTQARPVDAKEKMYKESWALGGFWLVFSESRIAMDHPNDMKTQV